MLSENGFLGEGAKEAYPSQLILFKFRNLLDFLFYFREIGSERSSGSNQIRSKSKSRRRSV